MLLPFRRYLFYEKSLKEAEAAFEGKYRGCIIVVKNGIMKSIFKEHWRLRWRWKRNQAVLLAEYLKIATLVCKSWTLQMCAGALLLESNLGLFMRTRWATWMVGYGKITPKQNWRGVLGEKAWLLQIFVKE